MGRHQFLLIYLLIYIHLLGERLAITIETHFLWENLCVEGVAGCELFFVDVLGGCGLEILWDAFRQIYLKRNSIPTDI